MWIAAAAAALALLAALGAARADAAGASGVAIADALQRYGTDFTDVPPVVWTVFATSVSQALVMERALGMDTGHAETFAFCEEWIRRLEGDPLPPLDQRA